MCLFILDTTTWQKCPSKKWLNTYSAVVARCLRPTLSWNHPKIYEQWERIASALAVRWKSQLTFAQWERIASVLAVRWRLWLLYTCSSLLATQVNADFWPKNPLNVRITPTLFVLHLILIFDLQSMEKPH